MQAVNEDKLLRAPRAKGKVYPPRDVEGFDRSVGLLYFLLKPFVSMIDSKGTQGKERVQSWHNIDKFETVR